MTITKEEIDQKIKDGKEKYKDYIGKRIHKLVIKDIDYVFHETDRHKRGLVYVCDCDCGKKDVKIFCFRLNVGGGVTSCGCGLYQRESRTKEERIARYESMIGKTIGNLFIKGLFYDKDHKPRPLYAYICDCECGNKDIKIYCYLVHTEIKLHCGCKKSGPNHAQWNGVGNISGNLFKQFEKGAARRKIPFQVTKEQIWELFLKQDGKCALSGIELQFQSKNAVRDGTASLDRIDSGGIYEIENLQWVHKDINRMKWILSDDKFLEYISIIYKYQKSIGVL